MKKTLNLSIPAALNSLLDILNIVIDLIMVGYLGAYALASIGVSMGFVMILWAFVTIYYTGTSVLVSRFVGAKDFDNANITNFNLSFSTIFISAPLIFFGLFISGTYFDFMGVGGITKSTGEEYLSIILFGLPFIFLKTVMASTLNSYGNTRVPFFVKSVGSLVNIALNYIFIYGNFGAPELGVFGAGLSTFFVGICETIIFFIIFLKKGILSFKYTIFDISLIKRAFKVGIPTGVERFFTFLSLMLITKFIASYSVEALAGYQTGLRAEGIAYMPGIGFMIASMVLIGQSIGANNIEEGYKGVKTASFLSSVFMGSIGLVMIIFDYEIARIFTTDSNAIIEIARYLEIIGYSQIPLAMVFVYDGGLRGAGATKLTFLVNTTTIWLIRVLPIYILSTYKVSIDYIYWMIVLETFIRGLILKTLFDKGHWRDIRV